MIPFFVGYAMIVWFYTCKWRRSWRALAIILAGVVGLVVLNWIHYELGQHFDIFLPVLRSLMYPYTLLVFVVGVYIALLPRKHPPGFCGRCGYNLDGLEEEVTICPECGKNFAPAPAPTYRRSGARRPHLGTSDAPLPAQHAMHHTAQQHGAG